jgi:cobalt transporter subunit CbtA
MLRRIVFSASIAGALAGLFLFAIQAVFVNPLIIEAETYENEPQPVATAPVTATDHAADHTHDEGDEENRALWTVLTNIITGIGFGLMLIAGFALRGDIDLRRGILWGVAGFIAFNLAPALGLPPELPADYAAPLAERQMWWVMTVVATAGGLALIAFTRSWLTRIIGLVVIAVPHIVGAPHPDQAGGLAPDDLRWQFQIAALVTMALFWAALGGLSGYFYQRFEDA